MEVYMDKLIAVCGLDCILCNAYIATISNDDGLREKTAAEWTVAYKFPFTKEMINCTGCIAKEGPKIGHCSKCEMRTCAMGKRIDYCILCEDYPCKTVGDFHAKVPAARENLEKMESA